MSTALYRTIQVLEQVVKVLPVGTNLALLHLMWAMLNGSFLRSRGAVHSALVESGFNQQEVRRSWQALRHGVWHIQELIERWRELVQSEGQWQVREYEGFRPLSVDITAFWRPRLQFWPGKFFHRLAQRAVKGIGFGVIAQIGAVDGQRIPLLKRIIRVKQKDHSEAELKAEILRQIPLYLDKEEVFIHDAGMSVAEVQAAKIPRFVLRLAVNCTGRRHQLPPQKQRGRRTEYGHKVRPLSRQRKGGQPIAATPCDVTDSFEYAGRTIEVQGWRGLVRADQKVLTDQETFTIWLFNDPLYRTPLLLATNLSACAETILRLYLDRWPVEQPPLAAKQMIGLQRQFVFAPVSCLRLPELALLTGNILTYLAAVLPAVPTGFWDRHPKKHRVGCGDCWLNRIFPKITLLTPDFEKSSLLPLIYPRELRLIAAKNDPNLLIPSWVL
jgi:hypothetical protein